MMLTAYLKPAIAVVVIAALGGGFYWLEHRSHTNEKDAPSNAQVMVTKSTKAYFSDTVQGTGFIVARREAVVGVDQEGSRVTEVLVHEGDTVTENQELARLTPPPAQPGNARPAPTSLRAPAAGLITEVRTIAGAPASPQAGPMFRICVNNEIELDAEIPGIHILKLTPGATVRIIRDNATDIMGQVRLVAPQIDRTSQLGHIRISLNNAPLKIGTFTRVKIDARRSFGVAVPHTAIDHLTVQVVKGNTVETRKVRIGLVSDTDTEILEGLDVGETVVADAGSSLHDGDQIKTMFADEFDRSRVR